MTLLLCWVWFPLLLTVVALGCGLLLERIAGLRLAGTLLVPAGFALLAVAVTLATALDALVWAALPLALALAALGYALGWRALLRRRPSGTALALGVAVLLAYGAPVLLSGQATFTGYIQLDDNATFLALTAKVLDSGQSLHGLAPSTYEATLGAYLTGGYPLGSMLPLGTLAHLTGEDMIWLYQPYLAWLAALLALSLAELVRGLIARRGVRMLVAFVAAQPAILYAYAGQGGVKEVFTSAMLATLAAVALPLIPRARARAAPAAAADVDVDVDAGTTAGSGGAGAATATRPAAVADVGPAARAGGVGAVAATRSAAAAEVGPASGSAGAGAAATRPAADRARTAVPVAVVTAALVAAIDIGAAPWVAPVLVAALIAALVARRGGAPAPLARQAALCVAVTAALVVPLLINTGFLSHGVLAGLETSTDLGNLSGPLPSQELFGVWPTGDHRLALGSGAWLVHVLQALMALAALGGVAWAARRRRPGPLVYVLGVLVGWAIVSNRGGTWVDAKALAIAAPALLLAALISAAGLVQLRGRRAASPDRVAGAASSPVVAATTSATPGLRPARLGGAAARAPLAAVGAALVLAIAGGVLWSNALAFRDLPRAPRDRLAEAEAIGKRFAGDGPTLDNEYEPYAARYLLRRLDAEGPSELRRRVVPLTDGRYLLKGAVADLDLFQLSALLVYRTLVVPRNPAASRPPSLYRRVWHGRYYDVWQRPAKPRATIVRRLAVGDYARAAVVPRCSDVLAFARDNALPGGQLVAALRPEAVSVPPLTLHLPPGWVQDGFDARRVAPGEAGGTATGSFQVPRAGRYAAWLGGSFARGFAVRIDGHPIGEARAELHNLGQYSELGAVRLAAGPHTIAIRRLPRSPWRPGSGSRLEALGTFVLDPLPTRERLVTLAPSHARRLCGRSVDWLEMVRNAPEAGEPVH